MKYPKLKPWELEPDYSQHVAAMTAEGLDSKGDIAEQLAWRDRQLAAALAKVAELDDIAYLDDWLKGEASGECRDWEMMYVELTAGAAWLCTLSSNTGVTSWDRDFSAATPAAARRAGVEYLKKEGKDG